MFKMQRREGLGESGLWCAVVGQWVVERAVDTAKASCSVDVVEQGSQGVGLVQYVGEGASGVAERAEVDSAV